VAIAEEENGRHRKRGVSVPQKDMQSVLGEEHTSDTKENAHGRGRANGGGIEKKKGAIVE